MRGIRALTIVFGQLQSIELPSLRRPAAKPGEPTTEEFVQWGISLYVYSLIAHLQKILAGLVLLAGTENVAASAPICRHVFEWAALNCYLKGRLIAHFKQHDWEEAWQLLSKVAIGSIWIRKHGGEVIGDPPVKIPMEWPNSVYIPDAVKEYERYQSQNSMKAEARDHYSLLCDHGHATAACLLRYHQWEENGAVVRFVDPDLDPQQDSLLPFVNCCLIDLLTFAYELLGSANETLVRSKILLVLTELRRLAPAHLTGSVPA